MNVDDYLQTTFPNVIVKPSLFHQWDTGIHFALAQGLNPFKDDGKLNADMFEQVYRQATAIFHDLFGNEDNIYLVTNVYQRKGCQNRKKTMKLYDRYLKRNEVKYHVRQDILQYVFHDEEEADQFYTSRFSVKCRKPDMKYTHMIKAACNEDFPPLKPRLNQSCCSYYPDLFFINATKNVIFFIYDDRGCEVIAADKEVIRPLCENIPI
ncbi:DUF3885 domain-containing protein [Brevibacillus migulae]|uniref:DUF3885 domain-containing protein n=1 Tax=Brevibacillus migulae TaxID=1644114 RepID=UPI00106E7BE3|nr:DUF3885 domain-containing protein [Brevibacillus migulae]